MECNSLVSVIVPIYNVQKYLEKCINSAINQTYHNIELILVDDGSTDESGIICDRYMQRDERIKVIHQDNRGQAVARNTGIDTATGEFVLFLDSDDYISEDHIESLLQQVISNNADMAIGELLCVNESGIHISNPKNNGKVEVLNPQTALYELMRGKSFSSSPCCKIYKKELFLQVRFPEGRIYEDVGTVYKTIMLSKKIVLLNKASYFYVYRNKSTAHQNFNEKVMDAVYMTEEMVKGVLLNFPDLLNIAYCNLFGICTVVLGQMNKYRHKACYLQVKDRIQYLRKTVLLCRDARMKHRLFAAISFLGVDILYLFLKLVFLPVKKKVKPPIG